MFYKVAVTNYIGGGAEEFGKSVAEKYDPSIISCNPPRPRTSTQGSSFFFKPPFAHYPSAFHQTSTVQVKSLDQVDTPCSMNVV